MTELVTSRVYQYMPQVESTENFRNLPRISQNFLEKVFFRNLMEKSFLMFSDNVRLSENISEHFWKFLEYFHVSLHQYCFQCIFVFYRMFFRVFESVKLHELVSQSSNGNIWGPAHP